MAFSCGCQLKAGEPISYEMIKEHYKHTMEALLFWELVFRKEKDFLDQRLKLSNVRMKLLNIIEEMFPEVEGG